MLLSLRIHLSFNYKQTTLQRVQLQTSRPVDNTAIQTGYPVAAYTGADTVELDNGYILY